MRCRDPRRWTAIMFGALPIYCLRPMNGAARDGARVAARGSSDAADRSRRMENKVGRRLSWKDESMRWPKKYIASLGWTAGRSRPHHRAECACLAGAQIAMTGGGEKMRDSCRLRERSPGKSLTARADAGVIFSETPITPQQQSRSRFCNSTGVPPTNRMPDSRSAHRTGRRLLPAR